MRRPASIRQSVFATLTMSCIAAAWWGCSTSPEPQTTETTSQSASSGNGGAGGAGETGGAGGMDVVIDGGSTADGGGACTSISATAQPVKLDIIFLIDQSGSMSGPKWIGTTSALKTFFKDPKSANIGAGLSYFPNHKPATCVPVDYATLDVPINTLPLNSFALTNSMPADATGVNTPTYGALRGALMAAAAYQDAHLKNKVIVVLATDGDPNACGTTTIDDIAALAKSARDYNGVLTYVIGVAGSTIANLDKIAAAGGTAKAYDVTNDISEFSAKMAEIRSVSLGCEFEIPPPPSSQTLVPDEVNFSYTPKGVGMPTLLPRADDLADCGGKPGWYYDNNTAPTKIIICPASCTTVQADSNAMVSALFGCKSVVN